MSSAEVPRGRWLEGVACALIVLVLTAFVFRSESHVDGMVDSDSYFHTAYASRMMEHGLSRSFEWTTFSSWRDHFADYNLTFHLFIAAFMTPFGMAGAKAATALLASISLALLVTFPLRHRLRWPLLWGVLVLAIGWHVIFRLLPVRPHVMSFLLTLLWLEASLVGRRRTMLGLAFVLAWNHFSAPLLLPLAAAGAIARRYPGGRWEWGALGYTAIGLAAGYLINPYVPNNLVLAFQGVVTMFGESLGADPALAAIFGQEFAETGTRQALVNHAVPFVFAFAALVPFLVSRATLDARSRVVLAYGFVVFILGCVSSRFLHELAVPVWFIAGSVLTDRGLASRATRVPSGVARAAGGIAVIVAVTGLWRLAPEVERLRDYRTQEVYEPAVTTLRRSLPAGAQVFHLGTGDFNALYYFDPLHRYVTALDPMFMRAADPLVYARWLDILTQRDSTPVETIVTTFGAEAIFVRKARRIDRLFDEMLSAHPGVERIYADEFAAVYRIVAVVG